MTYTVAALIGLAAAVMLDLAVLRTRLLGQRVFWLTSVSYTHLTLPTTPYV